MALLELNEVDGYLAFDAAQCREAGKALSTEYRNADPFPHIVVDDLIEPQLLRKVAANYPSTDGKRFFDRDQERYKYQFHPDEIPDGRSRNLFDQLNGRAFLGFLEEMTGIGGVIPDPYFTGGGLHLTRAGGHLSVHADFNVHEVMKVERRLNLLVYLNDDWPAEYGGNLELWDKAMTRCVRSVAPVLGRAVVFNTNLDSYHGQPTPLSCPPDRDRRSIATYYYTAHEDGLTDVPKRTTTFQTRPGTSDRTDWHVRTKHFIEDWVPPRIQPLARKFNRFR